MPRLRIEISGRVQGVGFRWFTRRTAGMRGISGFVMNLPDGTVLCEAQGEPKALDAFITDLRRGPPHGQVAAVNTETMAEQDEAGFEIR
jgi:acylphosphatase